MLIVLFVTLFTVVSGPKEVTTTVTIDSLSGAKLLAAGASDFHSDRIANRSSTRSLSLLRIYTTTATIGRSKHYPGVSKRVSVAFKFRPTGMIRLS